jgi:UDP-glucose 4-epimerase
MKVLVTGGAGFIGSAVVKELLSHDHTVKVADNAVQDRQYHDILSTDFPRFAQDFGPDVIIHLAADPLARNVVEQSAKMASVVSSVAKHCGCRVVFASSCAVYGASAQRFTNEEDTPLPITDYGFSKLVAEKILQASGVDCVILRMFNVAGPGFKHKPPRYVIPCALTAAEDGAEPLKVYGSLLDKRDYVHVDDVAKSYVKAIYCPAGVYNIGSGHGTSLDILLKCISFNYKPVNYVLDSSVKGLNYGVSRITASTDKAWRELGWKAKKDFMDILKDSIDWHVSRRANG